MRDHMTFGLKLQLKLYSERCIQERAKKDAQYRSWPVGGSAIHRFFVTSGIEEEVPNVRVPK